MPYLKITALEKIDTNKQADLFASSDANGIAVCIKQVALFNDDGVLERTVNLNGPLMELLKSTKIPLK